MVSVADAAAEPPTVTSVCRLGAAGSACRMGPSAGGYRVAIRGTGFSGVTAVTFASQGAQAFTVDSPTRITAMVPAAPSNEGVRVRVTAGGETSSSGCGFLHPLLLGCDDAFFYASSAPFAVSRTNTTFFVSAAEGFRGVIRFGSWSLRGSVQESHGRFFQAGLVAATLSVTHVHIHLSVTGGLERDRLLRLVPLTNDVWLFLRLGLSVHGPAAVDDRVTSASLGLEAGWVNGRLVVGARRACNRLACLGHPTFNRRRLNGTIIVGPAVGIGAGGFNIAAGPVLGISTGATGLLDKCIGLQGKADVPANLFPQPLDVLQPTNVSGSFASCPL
jgi:hypothetical protein